MLRKGGAAMWRCVNKDIGRTSGRIIVELMLLAYKSLRSQCAGQAQERRCGRTP